MSLEGRKLYKVLLACLCFFLSGFFMLVLVLNVVSVQPLGIVRHMPPQAIVAAIVILVMAILLLLGGIRLMKRSKKKQQPVELLGEEF
ncbi:MAG: hypothetical protein J7623_03020 [Chitinophaga sp.]|uniref:hypothetical protein n=1 Tax=Chitinophaga sp. TaxID=1869181 RepID=UPI001AFFDC45|nr:hypothetical protein [Chitinophaga sp.]MBO9727590.1 hypothetical protein [Chitinophaga sp.]